MTAFGALHRPGDPLVLPNAWDVASALSLQDAGFEAVGTTSLGITAAAGLPDGSGHGLDETVRLVERLAGRLAVPLTVDLEGGFSEEPAVVAALCAQLAALGVAGVNLEDGQGDGLRPAADLAEVVGAVVSACPDLFVNARTDVHWLQVGAADGREAEVLVRLKAYVAAGAHGVFVPGLSDPRAAADIVRQVAVPLNLLWTEALDVEAVRAAGVARLSTGSALYRAGLGQAMAVAERARGGAGEATVIDYGRLQALLADAS